MTCHSKDIAELVNKLPPDSVAGHLNNALQVIGEIRRGIDSGLRTLEDANYNDVRLEDAYSYLSDVEARVRAAVAVDALDYDVDWLD